MSSFLVTFILVFIGWILLTFSFNVYELLLGLFISLIIAHISCDILFRERPWSVLSPLRWVYGIVYIIALIGIEIKTHLDICYRIITGRISPAIIKIPSKNKTNIQKTLLGNSITLTPGTLTVTVTDDLYVHWIHYHERRRRASVLERLGEKVVK